MVKFAGNSIALALLSFYNSVLIVGFTVVQSFRPVSRRMTYVNVTNCFRLLTYLLPDVILA